MAWTRTRTAIAVGVVVLLAAGTTVVVKKVQRDRQAARVSAQKARAAEWEASAALWRTNQWADERKQEIARIKSRQQADETVNAATIESGLGRCEAGQLEKA